MYYTNICMYKYVPMHMYMFVYTCDLVHIILVHTCICIWYTSIAILYKYMYLQIWSNAHVYVCIYIWSGTHNICTYMCMYLIYIYSYAIQIHVSTNMISCTCICWYIHIIWNGVASVSRIDKIIGLFCKRALWKRRYSAKETYNLIDPTYHRHPIHMHVLVYILDSALDHICTYMCMHLIYRWYTDTCTNRYICIYTYTYVSLP